jgi:hypothetical protein
MANVSMLHYYHARVVAQGPGKLAVPDIDRVDAFCAALQ